MPTTQTYRGCDSTHISVDLFDATLTPITTPMAGLVAPGEWLRVTVTWHEDGESGRSRVWYGPGAEWDGVSVIGTRLPFEPVAADCRRFEVGGDLRVDATPDGVSVSTMVVIPRNPAPPAYKREVVMRSDHPTLTALVLADAPRTVVADAVEEFTDWSGWFAQTLTKGLRS